MKNTILFAALMLSVSLAAQIKPTKSSASFELGSGLNFTFNDSAYFFRISGMVQPYIAFQKQPEMDADYFFNSKRSYFNLGGAALKEKISFFVQLDFSLSDPLLDAWIAYHPTERLTITAGQKQTIANNREMLVMETFLQFPDRSLLSSNFSNTGREFGLFVDYRFGGNSFGIVPQVAVTSGDGRNSFGADSRDIDLGGFKYAARLDVYPLGFFTKGNDKLIADLMHEDKVKVVIGAAASFNDGASEAVGEGHGEFMLYNANGALQQPDYRQVYGDVLMKYKGFSLLGEYGVATATNLTGTFTSETGNELVPTQISEYLALGNGYNVQVGYVTKSGYALDFRVSGITPEFEENVNSITQQQDGWTVGFSKYFKGNNLKIQTAFSSLTYGDGTEMVLGEVIFQVIF